MGRKTSFRPNFLPSLLHFQIWIFYKIPVRNGIGRLSRNILSWGRTASKPRQRVKNPAFYLTSKWGAWIPIICLSKAGSYVISLEIIFHFIIYNFSSLWCNLGPFENFSFDIYSLKTLICSWHWQSTGIYICFLIETKYHWYSILNKALCISE